MQDLTPPIAPARPSPAPGGLAAAPVVNDEGVPQGQDGGLDAQVADVARRVVVAVARDSRTANVTIARTTAPTITSTRNEPRSEDSEGRRGAAAGISARATLQTKPAVPPDIVETTSRIAA